MYRSKALAGLLAVLGARPAAELLDLGPVVGANIAFFGDRVPCKIHIEDLYADLDRHVQEGALEQFPDFLQRRLPLPDESIDVVLCWDLFDYLEPPAAAVLAAQVTRLIRPGGAVLALFATVPAREPAYTRYVIEDEEHVRYRARPAAASRRREVLQNRDILRMFDRLQVSDSTLLRSQVREMLFRKPAETSAPRPAVR